jgi:PhoPQ-activated pathogenicity-related protein
VSVVCDHLVKNVLGIFRNIHNRTLALIDLSFNYTDLLFTVHSLEDSLAFKFWALQNEKRWDFGIKLNSTRNILVRSSAREFVGGNLIYGFASLIDVSESIFL